SRDATTPRCTSSLDRAHATWLRAVVERILVLHGSGAPSRGDGATDEPRWRHVPVSLSPPDLPQPSVHFALPRGPVGRRALKPPPPPSPPRQRAAPTAQILRQRPQADRAPAGVDERRQASAMTLMQRCHARMVTLEERPVAGQVVTQSEVGAGHLE